jgi:TatD DNase family protein
MQEWVIRNAGINKTAFTPQAPGYGLSVGVHPWFSHLFQLKETLEHLKKAVQNPQVLAIGEIGLDRAKGPALQNQLSWFEAQLQLAEETKKPAIIHCVRAYSDVYPYLKKWSIPLILHGYNGNKQQTRDLLKFPQVYFSLGERLFSADPQKVEGFLNIPTHRLFFETDTAGISIEEIYAKYSLLSGIPQMELKQLLWKNYLLITGKETP